jgi:hypothetical protein
VPLKATLSDSTLLDYTTLKEMRARRMQRIAFAVAALFLLLERFNGTPLSLAKPVTPLTPYVRPSAFAAPTPELLMTRTRARDCLAAFDNLPKSASWREFGANASTTSASAPLDAPDVELLLDGCPLLDRAEMLAALAGEHILFVGDSLMRFRYLNLLYHALSGIRSLPADGGGAGRGGLAEVGKFDAARGGAQLLGREVCDCAPWGIPAPHNRYAFLPEARLRLSYLQWRDGSLPLSGHDDEFLGLGCFERWHAAEANAASTPARAAQWLDDHAGFFNSRASAPGAALPLCQQLGCARGALDGRCDNASAPLQWEGEPPLVLESRVALLRPTIVVLGTYAWRKWSTYDRGPLPLALERIVRAAPSIRHIVWSAGTPDQVVASMSRSRVNETFGEGRLEENFDREAVGAVKAAIAEASVADSSTPAKLQNAASRFAVFDAALLAVPLVQLARERADVYRLWLDHVHFRFPVYHALNEALVTLLTALKVVERDN